MKNKIQIMQTEHKVQTSIMWISNANAIYNASVRGKHFSLLYHMREAQTFMRLQAVHCVNLEVSQVDEQVWVPWFGFQPIHNKAYDFQKTLRLKF